MKFHNGNPFTADDVVASISRILDPGARARGNLANVVKAEKVDDFTVDFVIKGPYPLLLNDLSGIFIMDKEWMEANDALKPGNIATGVTTSASTNANGTGPFKLESYKPDAGTDLRRESRLVGQAPAQSHAHRVQADQVGRDARRGAAVGRTRHDRAGAAAGPPAHLRRRRASRSSRSRRCA